MLNTIGTDPPILIPVPTLQIYKNRYELVKYVKKQKLSPIPITNDSDSENYRNSYMDSNYTNY
jgi:hypothetical protein